MTSMDLNDSIPVKFRNNFRFENEYRVLICRGCGHAIGELARHMQEVHDGEEKTNRHGQSVERKIVKFSMTQSDRREFASVMASIPRDQPNKHKGGLIIPPHLSRTILDLPIHHLFKCNGCDFL